MKKVKGRRTKETKGEERNWICAIRVFRSAGAPIFLLMNPSLFHVILHFFSPFVLSLFSLHPAGQMMCHTSAHTHTHTHRSQQIATAANFKTEMS